MRFETETVYIDLDWGRMKLLVLKPREREEGKLPGLLWLHGGGYFRGAPEMVYFSRGFDAARRFGAVVVSPDYRLSGEAPYPAAVEDAYAALKWLDSNKESLGVDRIMVGGESAGGGLTAALCMLAKDRGEVEISYQMPLYPMLDCEDTDSSRDNDSMLFWDTKLNHEAWKMYLGDLWGTDAVPEYASPSRRKDLHGLPPCYTFVADSEPFYCETLEYVKKLREAGVEAEVDVYHSDAHAFDLIFPWKECSKKARKAFLEHFEKEINKNKEE